MIIDWQSHYQNSEYYGAGLYSYNGVVAYTTVVAAVANLILLTDGRLAIRITDFLYQPL